MTEALSAAGLTLRESVDSGCSGGQGRSEKLSNLTLVESKKTSEASKATSSEPQQSLTTTKEPLKLLINFPSEAQLVQAQSAQRADVTVPLIEIDENIASHQNGGGDQSVANSYWSYQDELSKQQIITDEVPGPPFGSGNRLGFIRGEPVQGPMTQFAHGMQLFDEDVQAQEEKERTEIKNMANNFRGEFVTRQKAIEPARLIPLHDPTGRSVLAVDVANAQAETIREQRAELVALGEALNEVWKSVEILRIELWRRTVSCNAKNQSCSEATPNQSGSQSEGTKRKSNDHAFALLN